MWKFNNQSQFHKNGTEDESVDVIETYINFQNHKRPQQIRGVNSIDGRRGNNVDSNRKRDREGENGAN